MRHISRPGPSSGGVTHSIRAGAHEESRSRFLPVLVPGRSSYPTRVVVPNRIESIESNRWEGSLQLEKDTWKQ